MVPSIPPNRGEIGHTSYHTATQLYASSGTATTRLLRLRRVEVFGALTLLCVATAYLVHDHRANTSVSPPSKHCTLEDLLAKVPPPQRIVKLRDGDTPFIVCFGSVPPWTIRSGPPCYLFDESCRLVDWTPQTEEGWRFDPLCRRAWNEPAISIEQARGLCPKPVAETARSPSP